MVNKFFTKFCGITTINDALNAQDAGCDAVGFVFVKRSKRYIDPLKCRDIIKQLSPMTLTVALFSNNSKEEVHEILKTCKFHILQFHGNETEDFCKQFGHKYWKAIPMADHVNPLKFADNYPSASAYLIDNYGKNKLGGSGEKFDWDSLPKKLSNKWILAGGLTVDNIQEARQNTNIINFDVSSGIEKTPGIKSLLKMKQFITNLND